MVNFPTQIPECDSHILALLDFFVSCDTSIYSTMTSPPLVNFDHIVFSVSIDFPINSKRDALFRRIAYNYSCADQDGLCHHLRDVPWEDIFEFSAFAARDFCKWVQVEINVYILHQKYQLKPDSFQQFSAASAAAIFHRNYFWTNRINLLNLT